VLLWGSSIGDVKNKYPYIEENELGYFTDNNLSGEIVDRYFDFIDNKLCMVSVHYGNYSNNDLNILRKTLKKNYGIRLIKDDSIYTHWYINNKLNNIIVFEINKFQDNSLSCYYMNNQLVDVKVKNNNNE